MAISPFVCGIHFFLVIANKNNTSETARLHSDLHCDKAEEDVFPHESKRVRLADVAPSTQPTSNCQTDESVALKESDTDCYSVEKDLSAHKNECVETSSFQTLKQVHTITHNYFHFAVFKVALLCRIISWILIAGKRICRFFLNSNMSYLRYGITTGRSFKKIHRRKQRKIEAKT